MSKKTRPSDGFTVFVEAALAGLDPDRERGDARAALTDARAKLRSAELELEIARLRFVAAQAAMVVHELRSQDPDTLQ